MSANQDSIPRGQHNSEASSSYKQNTRSLTDLELVFLHDFIANSIWGQ